MEFGFHLPAWYYELQIDLAAGYLVSMLMILRLYYGPSLAALFSNSRVRTNKIESSLLN